MIACPWLRPCADAGLDVSVDKRELPAGRYRLGLLLGGPGLADGFRDLGIETVVG